MTTGASGFFRIFSIIAKMLRFFNMPFGNLIALIYLRCGGRVIYAFLGILEILKLCCHPLFGLRIYR